MAGSGINLAVTTDGGSYNKLQRPQDFLTQPDNTTTPTRSAPTNVSDSATATKRKHEYQHGSNSLKRAKQGDGVFKSNAKQLSKKASQNLDYGMRTALPGLEADRQSPEGIGDDALAYLRSVRSEASAIPDLLVSGTNSRNKYDDGDEYDTQQAVYQDGTWFAVDGSVSDYDVQGAENDVANLKPQDRLYQLLLKRFHALRAVLTKRDSGSAEAEPDNNNAFKRMRSWTRTVKEDYPSIKMVQSMRERELFNCIECCTHAMRKLDLDSIPPQLGCWGWTLLAAVDARTLDIDMISKVRELGIEAGRIGERSTATLVPGAQPANDDANPDGLPPDIQHGEVADGESTVDTSISEDGEVGEQSGPESELEQARARLLAQLGDRLVQSEVPSSEEPQQHGPSSSLVEPGHMVARVTIDTILTVVAECFGQKDLLRYRQPW